MEARKKSPLLRNASLQTLLASLVCIVLGLIVGYLALLLINPAGAGEAILVVIKNFFKYNVFFDLIRLFVIICCCIKISIINTHVFLSDVS